MERKIKLSIAIISLSSVFFLFQNCTEFQPPAGIEDGEQAIQLEEINSSLKKEADLIDPLKQTFVKGNPMALFVNCMVHYQSSKQNMFDLNPGFVRVFVSQWGKNRPVETVFDCMEELDSPTRKFMLQFTNISEEDDLDAFEDILHRFNDRFGDKIKYWQLGNEIDNNKGFPYEISEMKAYVARLDHMASFLQEHNPKAKVSLSITSKVFDEDKAYRLERFEALRKEITKNYNSDKLSLDFHYHHDFEDAEKIVVPLRRLLNRFKTFNPEFVMTENNTPTGKVARRTVNGVLKKYLNDQTEQMQASYGLRTVALALSLGAKHTTFGYPLDRPFFLHSTWVDHHFAMNGLFYNPDKDYPGGGKRGPKFSAYAYWLLSQLFERQIQETGSPFIVSNISEMNKGLYRVKFSTIDRIGKTFEVIWMTGYESSDEVKKLNIDIDANKKIVIKASQVGKRMGWEPSSLGDFLETFDITKRRGSFTKLNFKQFDTYIIINR